MSSRIALSLRRERRLRIVSQFRKTFLGANCAVLKPAVNNMQSLSYVIVATCCTLTSSLVRVVPSIYLHNKRAFSSIRSSSYQLTRSTATDEPEVLSTNTTKNFITNIIDEDIREKKNGGRVVTRFPPEPNGYLHLGHAKSICFNFGVAKAYNGVTHMRMDDTNPAKEEIEYVESILADVKWLVGTEESAEPWFGPVRHASDYFSTIHDAAVYLIKQGLAYVDELTAEEMKVYRGTLTEPGKDSPFRSRPIEESLRLFAEMREGKLPDGRCILRAKIDNSSPNMNMRDPTLYRIKRASHPMTGDAWCIYPMYDFAHAISDALEGITHSLCTLEFADHRPLYDWIIDNIKPSGLLPYADKDNWRPVQTEFSRLNLQYTVLSKRKLIQLVMEKHVQGWDDPRMPTISGVRRRGYPAAAIRLFCDRMGVSKAENNIDMGVLEDCVRDTLDAEAPRALAISHPLKVTITNWDQGDEEIFTAERHPKRPEMGSRDIPFSGAVYIDREDFFDTGADGSIPVPKGYKRLVPGGQVRLKYAYVITCDKVMRDDVSGEVTELICSYDKRTRAGVNPEGAKKAKGIIQWVSQKHAVPAQLALFDRLFLTPSPGKDHEDGDFLRDINPRSLQVTPLSHASYYAHTNLALASVRHQLLSLQVLTNAVVEPSLASAKPGERYQFERLGYFCADLASAPGSLVFNRVVTLKDTWEEASQAQAASPGAAAANDGGAGDSRAMAKPPSAADSATSAVIASEDVLRVELRVGVILSAERHPDADTLYVEKIDCGDASGPRTVISGLAKFYPDVNSLVGKQVVVVCNLKPSKMRGILSEGMVLAASSGSAEEGNEVVELVGVPKGALVGELVTVEGLPTPTPDPQLKSKTALDAWKRVVSALVTNQDGQATYTGATNTDGTKSRLLMTSAGPLTVPTLKTAPIR